MRQEQTTGGVMMIRKFMMAVLVVTCVSMTSVVFAEEVIVTQNGAKYHKEICRLVKNKDNVRRLDKEDALADDYGPCGRCFKEDIKAVESGQSGNVSGKEKKG